MKDSKEFLTSGLTSGLDMSYEHPLLGVKFISLNSFELIGEVLKVTDSIATVKDPFALGRDPKNTTRVNFIKLEQMNPAVGDEIQIPLASMLFFCVPKDQFVRNYSTARLGLVAAVTLP